MDQAGTLSQAARSRLDGLIDGLSQVEDQTLVQAWSAEGPLHWSYRDAGELAHALACGLRERVAPGETVALIGEAGPPWIVAALAALRAGAVATPLDLQLADDTLARVLEDSSARWVFTTTAHENRVRAAAPDAQIVLLDAGADDRRGWRTLAESTATLPDNHADDPAALFYTSGTTGPPKGVPLSHGNLGFQLDVLREVGVVGPQDRVLLPLPLHHVYPFVVGMLAPLFMGLTLILPPALTGPQIVRALREGRASVIIGVPSFYDALFAGITSRAERAGRLASALFHGALWLSRTARRRLGLRLGKWLLRPVHRQVGLQLRVLASGGSALDPELAWNLEALGWQLASGYGLTETAPLLTVDPPGRARPETVGRAVPGVELRIDRSAAPGGRDGEGEILARGPNVFQGYRNRPDKTREAFTGDGWYRTGDLGWLDGDGYLHITGRLSTLIVTGGGKNIQPDELESRYAAHPAVREIGILQDEGRLAALVVPGRAGGDDPEGRVRAALAEVSRALPSYQRLADFALTRKPLPRTRLGKIKRHELEVRFRQARHGRGEAGRAAPLDPQEMSGEDRSLLEQQAARSAWDWLARRYPRHGLTPDTSPRLDLGVDSMEWLTLTMEIGQRTGVELSDEAIARIDTVRDLLQELADATGRAQAGADPLAEPEGVLGPSQLRWLRPRGPVLGVAARILYGIDWMVLRGMFRLKARDRHHLPAQGPLVLACTHASHLDPFAVAAALGFERLRTLYWGGWTGVAFTNPFTRWVSRAAQVIPIDPRRGARTNLALAGAVLKRGRGLIWFPEGQRSPDGRLQPFRPGIGRLLEQYPLPVVLVSIRGTHAAMPPGRHIPRPRSVTVRFGEPLDPGRLRRQGEGRSGADRIVHALQEHMRALHERPPGAAERG